MSEPSRVVMVLRDVVTSADAMSFEDFFHLEKAGLYGTLCLVTRDRHEAEELTQDACVRVPP